MKSFCMRALACLVLWLLVARDSNASFIISIGNSAGNLGPEGLVFEAGGRVTLGIYGHNTATSTPVDVTNIGMAFDIAAPGSVNNYDGRRIAGGDSTFTDFTIALATGLIGSMPTIDDPQVVDSDAVPGHDLLVDISLSKAVTFAANGTQATAIHLANISFQISPSALDGIWGLKFVPGAQFDGGGLVNSISGNLAMEAGADTSHTNSFRIVATPEPSSLALTGLAAVVLVRARRRFTQ